jgi:hypothetical protein
MDAADEAMMLVRTERGCLTMFIVFVAGFVSLSMLALLAVDVIYDALPGGVVALIVILSCVVLMSNAIMAFIAPLYLLKRWKWIMRVPNPRRALGIVGGIGLTVELLVALVGVALLLVRVPASRGIMRRAAREQTVTTQRVVMQAILRYRDAGQSYPGSSSDGSSLMSALRSVSESREVLRHLPAEAWAGPGKALRDGFGEPMTYQSAGGLGGTPVLISKGPDRELGTPDDIRSDTR